MEEEHKVGIPAGELARERAGLYSSVTTIMPAFIPDSVYTVIRPADSTARKTVVCNASSTKVQIFEGGGMVAILNPDQTWISDGAGNLAIAGYCVGGAGVAITTYH